MTFTDISLVIRQRKQKPNSRSGEMSEIGKLLYRNPRLSNELSEETWAEFFMLWNGQGVFIAGLDHHHMGTTLS